MGERKVHMGVTSFGAAWVNVTEDGVTGRYRVEQYPPGRAEYGKKDLRIVEIPEPGEPFLTDDEVVTWAHDAFLDAYGAV